MSFRMIPTQTGASMTVTHLSIYPQNPGRVVTLVHKEDWDAFSGSVSTSRIDTCEWPLTLRTMTPLRSQDPFPDDDVVWGAA